MEPETRNTKHQPKVGVIARSLEFTGGRRGNLGVTHSPDLKPKITLFIPARDHKNNHLIHPPFPILNHQVFQYAEQRKLPVTHPHRRAGLKIVRPGGKVDPE